MKRGATQIGQAAPPGAPPGPVLYITRKFPPARGGMETLSYDTVTGVSQCARLWVIKWGGSQRWLPLWIIYALVRALLILATRPVAVIHIGDLVLAPLGLLLRVWSRRPVAANAHGLDIVYPHPFYQAVIPACARRLDLIICNSQDTRRKVLAHGIRPERVTVITPCAPAAAGPLPPPDAQRHWLAHWGLTPRPPRILLTVGRLVRRKGVDWFVAETLPRLLARRADWVYLVIGDGPQRQAIQEAVAAHGLSAQVRLLGRVDETELQAAYALADLFVMPNIVVPNDAEGFGLVSLEARAAGLPVLASRLEGISDAFDDTEAGALLPPGDAAAWAAALDERLDHELTLAERQTRRAHVATAFGLNRMTAQYLAAYRAVQTGAAAAEEMR